MRQDLKDEALEELELDIRFGFENEEELFESIRDMFYNEEDFDNDWLREVIAEKYSQHQKESQSWKEPTDFHRLAAAFDELTEARIVCLHKAGYTRQDGEDDCIEVIDHLRELGIETAGYCYYHEQDLARAIDPEERNLLLGFYSYSPDESEAQQVANKIIDVLKKHGFEVSWPGTVNKRIEIKNINWQKIPDDENWSGERVIQILTKANNSKKPFWKFWD